MQFGQRTVGEDHPTYIIAEAGVNHRCKLDLALQLIREARQAGADAIKFQTYKADTLVTRWAPRYWEDDEASGTQHAIFQQSDHFGPAEYQRMAEYCRQQQIAFLSTPFDDHAVHLLNELGVPAFKLASADLTNLSLLKQVARTGKPVIQSLGASTLDETDAWVNSAHAAGVRDICLLHCVLCYPTATPDANLRRIALLKRRFPHLLIGYSDHTDATVSTEVSVAAVTLGARVIEKHFTLDRSWPGDDHYHSADPPMLARMVAGVRTAEQILGHEYDGILPCEDQSRKFARRSIIAARALNAGETLSEDMLIMKRPGTGIAPTELPKLLGRKLRRPVKEDAALSWEDLE
jgi:N-acetylneuraminate synthase